MKTERIERDRYVVYSYWRPDGGHPRWRHNQRHNMVKEWAFALRSSCGTFYETSKSSNGHASQEAAETEAQKVFQ